MPTVFNKYHKPPSTAVYIGRGSPWGNPFVIGKDGDRDTVCDKYAAMGAPEHANLNTLHGFNDFDRDSFYLVEEFYDLGDSEVLKRLLEEQGDRTTKAR